MTTSITLESILEQEDAQAVESLKDYLHYQVCKKDPQGSPFYYLAKQEGPVRPIAVGFFDDLNGSDTEGLKETLKTPGSELYKTIYGHYLNRQFENQPALYVLLPKHKRGMIAFIKPTDSGLRVKGLFIGETDDREVFNKLDHLKDTAGIRKGLFVDTPNIDHLFYEPVGTAEQLAEALALITKNIERTIVELYQDEAEGDFLHKLHQNFKAELLPLLKLESADPKEYGFADLYAQTISYGMFTARCFMAYKHTNELFERQAVSENIPPTNPFLKSLFDSLSIKLGETEEERDNNIRFFEKYKALFDHIEDLVSCLASTDMEVVLKDWHRDKTHDEDMVIHFYETFLEKYNPRHREIRGVYYTPSPVVAYIVRSIDLILKEKFNKPMGLADPEVLILDPATGTGTFLVHVYKHLKDYYDTQMKDKPGDIGWDAYVDRHILPRLFGFELMMAPYAVAHLRLGVELQESGYSFASKQRLGIYMTNTMEETAKKSEILFEHYIANESDAATEIKREKPIMVVLGNPPYSNFGQLNKGEWIQNLMKDWQPLNEKKWNPDDFMKFMRWGQDRLEKTGYGVLAFITNRTYLEGITRNVMRRSLMATFDQIQILDLHGDIKEKKPEGLIDENVFDITKGVAIGVFSKTHEAQEGNSVEYFECWGTRIEKNKFLFENDTSSVPWKTLKDVNRESCLGAFHFFTPRAFNNIDEYCNYIDLQGIFKTQVPTIETQKDPMTIHLNRGDCEDVINSFIQLSENDIRHKYGLGSDGRDWKISTAKSDVIKNYNSVDDLTVVNYRPFDKRWTFYSGNSKGFMAYPRHESGMKNFHKKNNVGLCTLRQSRNGEAGHFFVVGGIVTKDIISLYDRGTVFPLYLYLDSDQGNLFGDKESNFQPAFLSLLAKSIGLQLVDNPCGDLKYTFGVQDVFAYLYSVFYSQSYRDRYADLLCLAFPRLPLTSKVDLFRKLCLLGHDLVDIHLLNNNLSSEISFPVKGNNKVETPRFVEKNAGYGMVFINDSQYFDHVPSKAWQFLFGGYQVSERWLKDRKNFMLTQEDIEYYKCIVEAISRTINLMTQIDNAIEEHGGWPIQ